MQTISEHAQEFLNLEEITQVDITDLRSLTWQAITGAGISADLMSVIPEKTGINKKLFLDWLSEEADLLEKQLIKIAEYFTS
ncbi:hypothetical protein MN033_11030 [Bacillus nitratireducens]|uniref:hypothetical protein n=1 Tax=Bacillus nitratireducens TaxID=2026193 RepID=UPI001F59FA4F|nr:hypothetical protein [Bacillus nitratireducens]UNP78638.1 hypothetical protein MN033_11030 [Bacillus nitratireducens]